MEEMNLTDEQRARAMGFSCAYGLTGLASAASRAGKEFGTLADLDHAIRHTITEALDITPESPDWPDTYIEYVCQQAILLEYGEPFVVERFTHAVAHVIGVGAAHVVDLCDLPEVAVIPNPESDFGVPSQWTDQ